ncbi:unnamed protein product [Blepharisma stoltei]|uniref:Uncharacterized protein n=1 Tax=Blepharisma stoltei TaxID=1481888 RepID=A0AAU9K718_9CILI|nr:unnamed protein product [Blepharisma stoltei]
MGNLLEGMKENNTLEVIMDDLQNMEFPTIPSAISNFQKRLNEAVEVNRSLAVSPIEPSSEAELSEERSNLSSS